MGIWVPICAIERLSILDHDNGNLLSAYLSKCISQFEEYVHVAL